MKTMLLLCILPALTLAVETVKDGQRGGGAIFSACGGFFGGNDRCYDVVVTKLLVTVGADGTNEDVSAKICSDDKKTCCETPVLKSTLSDDWSANDVETWTNRFFGSCKDKKFTLKNGLELTLTKKGPDTLGVASIFIEAETLDKDKKVEVERFECGGYNIGGVASDSTSSTQAKFCKTSPYVYERVKQINVTMGPDGTDDSVRIDICSDVNDVCCRTKLSSLLFDDWSKNSVEIWKESDLGDCKTVQYKVNKANPDGGPRFTLIKEGKDDLLVNKILIDTEDSLGGKFRYDCGDFKLESQGQPCVPGVNCSQTRICKKSSLLPAAAAAAVATNGTAAASTSTAAPSTSTAAPPSSTTRASSTTTTRPPFRTG